MLRLAMAMEGVIQVRMRVRFRWRWRKMWIYWGCLMIGLDLVGGNAERLWGEINEQGMT